MSKSGYYALADLIVAESHKPCPVPLVLYPVTPNMYAHQIRAANMALLAFGYSKERDDFHPPKAGGAGFGLLFEMGCGKTLTAIAIAGALWKYDLAQKILVVAPSSVCSVWPKELEETASFPFAAEVLTGSKHKRLEALERLKKRKGAQVAVINYESLWRDGIFEALEKWGPDLIIADESQRIKNHLAIQSKALHRLGAKATYRLILSGTPIQNHVIDIFSQFKFLDPSTFGSNFYAFRNQYAVMGGFNGHQIIGYKNLSTLRNRAQYVSYRVTKAEALDLPEQVFENRYVQLAPKDRSLYNRLIRESFAELDSGGEVSAPTVLTKLLRLQQLTGGFLKADDKERPERVHTAKLEALMEMVKDLMDSGQKVVVFARFTAELDLISKTLEELGIYYGRIDGQTPMQPKRCQKTGERIHSRAEVVEDFQTFDGPMVFLAQIQTAGLGITLHAASTAIFYSLDFNFANYSQALARIHRIGQHHPCTYIHIVAENTVDEKVLKALAAKEDLAKSIVDNWKEYFTK